MKIKRVIAPTMPVAMQKIKEELGQDAIILNSKEVRTGGFLGFFTKKNVAVIAAIDPTPPKLERERKSPVAQDKHRSNGQKIEENSKVTQELQDIRKAVDNIKFNTLDETTHDVPKEIKDILIQLKSQEVLPIYIKNVEKNLMKEWYKHDEKLSAKDMKKYSYQFIYHSLSTHSFGINNHNTKQLINLVGPTGVGKTTTLAKLASRAVLEDEKKVAFITTDTYRIAAIEQLKTYAELLNIPLKVSYTLDEFKEAVQSFKEYDLILIDSAGRNYQDRAYINELKQSIDFSDDMSTYLVLSATSKLNDMKAIYEQFSDIPISQLIFTKTDETQTFGPLLNLLYTCQVGIAYMTNGQNVPDDIYMANAEDIAKKVLGVNNHG